MKKILIRLLFIILFIAYLIIMAFLFFPYVVLFGFDKAMDLLVNPLGWILDELE